jgi:hypothetical protein
VQVQSCEPGVNLQRPTRGGNLLLAPREDSAIVSLITIWIKRRKLNLNANFESGSSNVTFKR